MSKEMGMSKPMGMSNGRGGHLYMQTNETRNAVVHYHRGADGKITEVDRVSTGGAGFRHVQADQWSGKRT